MAEPDLSDALRDVAFTTTTPFGEDGESVLYDEVANNVEFLLDRGASLVVPCGNSGEYYSLSNDERVGVVEATAEAVGDEGTVLAGVGGSVRTALELARRYEDAGADGLMVMHPIHTYVHERGLVEYYRAIAEETDLDVVLYVKGPEVGTEVLEELSTHGSVVGVKYAVNDVKAFSAAVSGVEGDLVWVNGLAERFAPAFALEGAEGFTTGIGNFAPEASLALHDALEREDWRRARELRDAIRPFEDLREEPAGVGRLSSANNVPAVKDAMDRADLYGGPVRPPLVDLSAADEERAREYQERIRRLTG